MMTKADLKELVDLKVMPSGKKYNLLGTMIACTIFGACMAVNVLDMIDIYRAEKKRKEVK